MYCIHNKQNTAVYDYQSVDMAYFLGIGMQRFGEKIKIGLH